MLTRKRKLEMIANASGAAFLLFLPQALETPRAKTSAATSFYRRLARALRIETGFGAEVCTGENARRNLHDRSGAALTLLERGDCAPDADVTRRIRVGILARQELSLNARNVKIITVNGRVTLRGPVNTDGEKLFIGAIAEEVAKSGNVDNQLEVKPTSGSTEFNHLTMQAMHSGQTRPMENNKTS